MSRIYCHAWNYLSVCDIAVRQHTHGEETGASGMIILGIFSDPLDPKPKPKDQDLNSAQPAPLTQHIPTTQETLSPEALQPLTPKDVNFMEKFMVLKNSL